MQTVPKTYIPVNFIHKLGAWSLRNYMICTRLEKDPVGNPERSLPTALERRDKGHIRSQCRARHYETCWIRHSDRLVCSTDSGWETRRQSQAHCWLQTLEHPNRTRATLFMLLSRLHHRFPQTPLKPLRTLWTDITAFLSTKRVNISPHLQQNGGRYYHLRAPQGWKGSGATLPTSPILR